MTDLNDHKNNQPLSRRDALKTIAVAGGGIVFSSLPKDWEPPVIVAGKLPAFAQTSPPASGPTAVPTVPPKLSNPSVTGPLGSCDPGGGLTGSVFLVASDYTDADGDVIVNQARVQVIIDFPSGSSTSQEIPLGSTNISGDGFSGAINAPLCIDFSSDPDVTVTLILIDAAGLAGSPVSVHINRP